MLVPPKLAIDTLPKWGIVKRFTEWVRTFAISERVPVSKDFQVLEQGTLPLQASDLLLFPLKRVGEI